jgi:hypothetical protein
MELTIVKYGLVAKFMVVNKVMRSFVVVGIQSDGEQTRRKETKRNLPYKSYHVYTDVTWNDRTWSYIILVVVILVYIAGEHV